jgi:hypothetical protein
MRLASAISSAAVSSGRWAMSRRNSWSESLVASAIAVGEYVSCASRPQSSESLMPRRCASA